MKRIWKKLVAGAMAGVMALGMVVTAGATTQVTGSTITGRGGLESGKAGNTIKIVVPTFAAADLNMIIDPHGMIALTKGEAWEDNAGRIPTFASDTNIFFRNNVKNTTAQEISMTVDGNSVKAKVFKKVDEATTAEDIYKDNDTANTWYYDNNGTMTALDEATTPKLSEVNAGTVIETVTALPDDSGTGDKWRETEDISKITVSSAEKNVTKYEKVTVTGRWLVENEDDATKNAVYVKKNPAPATTASDKDTALSGKDIATITNDTNKYVPVPSTEYAYDYSAQSDAFKVINKSHMPLTVSVKAELSKGSAPSVAKVSLVDAKTDLVNEKDGKETGALMYLALVNDAEEDPIVMKDAVIEEEGENGAPDKYQVRDISVIRDYATAAYTGALSPSSANVNALDLIKGQPVFEWVTDDNDEKIALNDKIKNDATTTFFQVLYTVADDEFSVPALNGQENSGAYAVELVMQELDEEGEVVTEVKGNGVAVPVYLNIKKSASDDEAIARISMVLDGLKAGKLDADVTASNGPKVALKKWEPQGEAASKAALPVFESGFKLESTPGTTPISGMAANQVGASTSTATYAYTVNPGVPDSRFSTAKFSFDAGINTVDGWDLANAGSLSLSLIYSVNQYNAATDPELPEDKDPTVTVTTPGADASINALVMAITLGTGNSAYDRVTAIKWTPSGSTEKTIAVGSSGNNFFDEDALTVTMKYGVTTTANTNMALGTDWKMVFTNDLTGGTKEVDFDIHTAGTYPAS